MAENYAKTMQKAPAKAVSTASADAVITYYSSMPKKGGLSLLFSSLLFSSLLFSSNRGVNFCHCQYLFWVPNQLTDASQDAFAFCKLYFSIGGLHCQGNMQGWTA